MEQDILTDMQNDPRFQTDIEIIKLIRNDMLVASLMHEADGHLTNDELYDFDIDSIIFDKMKFSADDPDESASLWYYLQIRKVVNEIHGKGGRMCLEVVNERASTIYFELKKHKPTG